MKKYWIYAKLQTKNVSLHLLSLIDSCQRVVTSSNCVTVLELLRLDITKRLCLCHWRNAKVHVHLKVGRYTASSWFLLCQTREKPTSRRVVRRKHHRGKSRGKRFQNWAGHTNTGKQMFSYQAIDLWRDIPYYLKDLNTFSFAKEILLSKKFE